MKKPITPAMHGAIDYGMSAVLLTAPWLLRMSRKAALTFNGFGAAQAVIVTDEPMASLYSGERKDPRVSDNVVSLR